MNAHVVKTTLAYLEKLKEKTEELGLHTHTQQSTLESNITKV